MAASAIQEAECQRILATSKEIREDVRWSRKANEAWIEARARVAGEFQGSLEMVATVNVAIPSRYGFSLIMRGGQRISGLDVNGSHRNI